MMGFAIPVANKGRKPHEKSLYFALKVEDQTGKKEEWLLFTKKELERSVLDMGLVTEAWKPGRVYPHVVGSRKSFAVKIVTDAGAKAYLIGASVLESARKRALKNPEDVPKQSILDDMMD